MTKSTEFNSVLEAIDRVGTSIGKVLKDGTNPHFKSRYATLNAVLLAIEAPCQTEGLIYTQAPEGENKVTTLIYHKESKQWLEFTSEAPLQQQNAQGVGSLITYLRRYALISIFHLGTDDDDGNSASKTQCQPIQQQQQNSQSIQPQKPVFDISWTRDIAFRNDLDDKHAEYFQKGVQFSIENWLTQISICTPQQIQQVKDWYYGK